MDMPFHSSHHRAAHIVRWIPCVLLFLAGFLLLTEHRGPLLGALPYLLFAICPVLHLYHHRRHQQRRHADAGSAPPAPSSSQKPS